MKIAVIGGGWAGIAAAVELTARGVETTLFEAGRVLGGRARSIQIDGRTLDNGQHILLGAYRETLALMRRVGADPDALLDRRPLQIVDNAGFRMALPKWPAPFNIAWGLLNASPVDWKDKLKTAIWMDGVKRQKFILPNDITVSQWLDQAKQTGTLRRHLWDPLCLAALNLPAERASAQLFANVLRDSLGSPRREDTDLLLPRVDLGQLLPEPATQWLLQNQATIRLSSRVQHIEPLDDYLQINGDRFTAAVVATAPQHTAKLCPKFKSLAAFEPIATVYLDFGPKFKLPFPLFGMQGGVGQWAIDRGDGLIACVLSGHGAWENLDNATLASRLEKELAAPASAIWSTVIREQRATFAATPGLVRPNCLTQDRRIILAGDYTWTDYPATLEGAVRSGLRAANLASHTHAIGPDTAKNGRTPKN